MLRSARLVDLIMTDETVLQLHQTLPIRYMSSRQPLEYPAYRWHGELPINQVTPKDIVVALNTWAYRVRHQADGRIKQRITGSFKYQGKTIYLKVIGVIRNKQLFILTTKSSKNHRDIAPMQPVRLNGMNAALKFARKHFSSPELNFNLR